MARRFYIVSYDVTDDRRRNKVYKQLLDYGDHVQFSVFCCQLNARERIQLCQNLRDHLNQAEDQALILDAGPVDGQQPEPDMDYIGKTYTPSPRCQIV
ncbi:MAG: CRISPR-associated endonuclease Cas2 [Verrucomicrobia bacterium]|nr:CRISPR-associated endonuclease Cas2 [Verrucomicrobiota bacterium]MCG2679252.1 CRISPR-associated endonuclease Cas2 [Kiritimatiellia bacterium]MBU4248646.1 CRISPR-associated endonuclease Cas2 [Verrucomicrobiota bacterium]MBU4290107.1 CRISPR-associated endonuclease Cas2 [Verrucomicrobiota bacterium]MBU4430467.1 CRISPR-associated endonuclease Cas2 [Verrucomicrobiota bacterium]